MAQNLRQLTRKLQQAIAIQRGRRISINQYQQFSTKAQRTVTKYVLTEYDDEKKKYTSLFSTWSMPEVVKYLAGVLQGENTP